MIKVSVSKMGNGYVATIGGGWWMAHKETERAAIKAVVDRYENECKYHENILKG